MSYGGSSAPSPPTISPAASALKHTRSTLHYAGTASSIRLAPPKAETDGLEERNAELEKRNAELLKELEQRGATLMAHSRHSLPTATSPCEGVWVDGCGRECVDADWRT